MKVKIPVWIVKEDDEDMKSISLKYTSYEEALKCYEARKSMIMEIDKKHSKEHISNTKYGDEKYICYVNPSDEYGYRDLNLGYGGVIEIDVKDKFSESDLDEFKK